MDDNRAEDDEDVRAIEEREGDTIPWERVKAELDLNRQARFEAAIDRVLTEDAELLARLGANRLPRVHRDDADKAAAIGYEVELVDDRADATMFFVSDEN